MPNFTVYLPDDVAERARAADDLNLSGLLRQAVTEELDRRDRLAELSNGMEEQRVPSYDRDGNELLLRFTGKLVAGSFGTEVYRRFTGKDVGGGFGAEVYLLADGRVLVVYEEDYDEFANVAKFADFVSSTTRNNLGRDIEDALVAAATELGAPRVVDL